MPTTAKKEAEQNLVAEAAKAAMMKASGDVIAAARVLEQAVRSNQSLRDQLTDPLISNACYDAVRRQSITERKAVWKQPPATLAPKSNLTVDQSARVVQLAKGTLMMFPLPGGKPLGEATKEDLSAAHSFYASQSADMGHKARWLQLVAQSLPPGKVVSDVMSDTRLRELQDEARNG